MASPPRFRAELAANSGFDWNSAHLEPDPTHRHIAATLKRRDILAIEMIRPALAAAPVSKLISVVCRRRRADEGWRRLFHRSDHLNWERIGRRSV